MFPSAARQAGCSAKLRLRASRVEERAYSRIVKSSTRVLVSAVILEFLKFRNSSALWESLKLKLSGFKTELFIIQIFVFFSDFQRVFLNSSGPGKDSRLQQISDRNLRN